MKASRTRPILLGLIALAMVSACNNSSNSPTGAGLGGGVGPGPGGGGGGGAGGSSVPRHRYSFNNECIALRAASNDRYVVRVGTGYAASGDAASAEPFFFKPASLGQYLLYDRQGQLVSAATLVAARNLASADESAAFKLLAVGDNRAYPEAPQYDVEPTPAKINAYRNFVDPLVESTLFTLEAVIPAVRLAVSGTQALTVAAPNAASSQQFELVPAVGCASFPEAANNAIGETFKGTTPDGRVLGMADVHVHLSATTFLGGAQHGAPYHRFGVTHALDDCTQTHGPQGTADAVQGLFQMDPDGHATDGWPTFSEWPARDQLTHEAIYWKWLERAWLAGLRIMVNDVVDNETLCELQRNLSDTPLRDCNEMNNGAAQIGSMYGLQDYIDAQYGGPGKGWFRIVLDPAEARQVIAEGKLAVVLGVEISNLFNCKLNYSPLRTQQPFQETGAGGLENSYSCAMTETGADNEILTQLTRLKDLGVRQVITIHEFDNAFGGNGIFDALVLNIGNRENSGGIPSQDITNLLGILGNPSQTSPLGTLIGNLADTETPTGEFWTTYDCPTASDPSTGGGFFAQDRAGTVMTGLPPGCLFTGQGGRPGGTTPCYPSKPQCNARWLTPIGLYTYRKLMENGMIFDIDHLEYEMKTQALELAEAQTPAYPYVSTHGNFGGTSNAQAMRVLQNGGFIYPSLGNGRDLIRLMDELKGLWSQAGQPYRFGFGFGTDTNGLSAQASPRNPIAPGQQVNYPYTLFTGEPFSLLPDFTGMQGVQFNQPQERDAAGNGRSWTLDIDGSAHYGMLSGMVQEVRLEGSPDQMQHLFDSAEVYLQTWERTLAASQGIAQNGFVVPPGVLRAAPVPSVPIALP